MIEHDRAVDGFDNVAEVLQVSPSFLEQYLSAARTVSILAVSEVPPVPEVETFEAPSLANQYRHVKGLPMGTRGGFAAEHYFPAAGEYEFNVEIASQEGSLQRSYPTWWLESKHQFILTIDGEEVYTTSLGGPEDSGGFDGIQAEFVRVPFANVGCVKLPDEVTDDQAILISDIFPTGQRRAIRVPCATRCCS